MSLFIKIYSTYLIVALTGFTVLMSSGRIWAENVALGLIAPIPVSMLIIFLTVIWTL